MAALDSVLARVLPHRPIEPWMVGESAPFRALERDLVQIAPTDVTVLIEGECGSGKSVAARALHGLSSRAAGPFVEVALPALPETLIEAELFGHVEGAFTGAVRARTGRFMRANGGTLVLDAVECLPEALQLKLLRVLQERTIERVGSSEPVSVDVRIVATTSIDLRAQVDAGRFRGDLYFRLAVMRLHVPPLRARSADIPLLARFLMEGRCARRSGALREFEPSALTHLCAYPWPGNVRELENTIERLLALAPRPGEPVARPGDAVTRAAAPRITADELGFLDEAIAGAPVRLAQAALAQGVTLEAFERALLDEALRSEHGNSAAAARRVGLSRRAFDYRRSQHGDEASSSDRDPHGA